MFFLRAINGTDARKSGHGGGALERIEPCLDFSAERGDVDPAKTCGTPFEPP